jgi:hypothetical protein
VVGRAGRAARRGAHALSDPEDIIILEGYPCLDPRFKAGMVMHATKATTAGVEKARKEAQREKSTPEQGTRGG